MAEEPLATSRPAAEGRAVIAVDVGGTTTRIALFDAAGAIAARASFATETHGPPAAALARIRREADAIALRTGLAPAAIGAALPGPLDLDEGRMLGTDTLPGWRGFAIRDALADVFALPSALENDANAAALGEWRVGAGRGLRHLVYLTISTGIGAGVIADGRILHGRAGVAAEIGHMSVAPTSEDACFCGNRGCLEALASGSALAWRARRAGLGDHADARFVCDLAETGDRAARRLLDETADWLAIGITNVLHLFAPQAVVIGGGFGSRLSLLRQRLEAGIAARAMPAYRDTPVRAAALGDDAGLHGAAALAAGIA
jgi:glucokinase